MHVIEAANIRDAFLNAVQYILDKGIKEETRIGEALVAPEPVTIHYSNPKQHVLLNPHRDANPFFHLMEAMWMLAGRDDAAYLDYYVKDFGEMFGKYGVILDAYGHRWRHGYRYDQLDEIVDQLRKEPTTRQAVLQMWGAGRDDLRAYSSKPCNLSASFRFQSGYLNMTVFNRSNDLIWGCCGANAVHFPILQEYIAGKVGVAVGGYWQVTNNLHMYLDQYERMCNRGFSDKDEVEEYGSTIQLVQYPQQFDEDLFYTMDMIDLIQKGQQEYNDDKIANKFLRDVVLPMALAHSFHKQGDTEKALIAIDSVSAQDWWTAGKQWLERRNGR